MTEKVVAKVYIPLDYVGIGRAVGGKGKPYKEDAKVFGPLAGTVIDVKLLKELYAAEVLKSPTFGKRGGKAGSERSAASIRVGWMINHGVFPKVPA